MGTPVARFSNADSPPGGFIKLDSLFTKSANAPEVLGGHCHNVEPVHTKYISANNYLIKQLPLKFPGLSIQVQLACILCTVPITHSTLLTSSSLAAPDPLWMCSCTSGQMCCVMSTECVQFHCSTTASSVKAF